MSWVLVAALAVAWSCPWEVRAFETVYISRHCARATPMLIDAGPTDFPYLDNYSKIPFPAWGVPAYDCLPRGLQLLETFGENLKARGFPLPVVATADNTERDKATAEALLKGLGQDPMGYDIDASLFQPTQNNVCDAFPVSKQIALMNATYERIFSDQTTRESFQSRLAKLQGLCGTGASTTNIEDIPEYFTTDSWGAVWGGRGAVADDIIESFMMQVGGGFDVAWGKLKNIDELYGDLLQAHILYRVVMARTPVLAAQGRSNLLSHFMAALEDSSTKGTRMYVGHDSDLDGIASMLDLTWASPPFATNATTPGSALRFDMFHGDANIQMIRVNLYYTTFESNAAVVRSVPANFSTGKNVMTYADFRSLAHARINYDCVAKN